MATDKFVVKNGLLVGTNIDDGVNLVQVNGTISATNLLYSGTISGDGSGLTNVNATTLDSVDSTQFLRSDAADTKTSGNLSFSDNVRAVFGTGNDLQIFHDGSNSYIQDAGTGNLRIDATNLDLRNATGLKTYASFVDGGAASLRFNDATKLATTATGITVTGSVTASEIIAASTDLDITGNAIISGNLTVNGTTTSLNTTTVTTEDSVIVLNSGQTTPANDIGLILQRFSSPTTTNYNVAIVWDEGSDRLMFGATAETGADADITVSSEWMTITGAGSVGIGVTNPAFSSGTGLEIQRSGTATLRLDSLAFATELRGTTTGTELYQLSAGFLDLGTSGTTRMRITSGGNIGIGVTNPTGRVEIADNGAVNDRLLYLNSSTGLSLGQTGPFYGLYSDIVGNNNATSAYGVYSKGNSPSGSSYGIYAESTQSSSTVDSIGVLGKAIVNSASTNHRSDRAIGSGPVAGVYASVETTGTSLVAQTTALHAKNSTIYGAESYGAWIETVAGPTSITPLKVVHAGNEILKVASSGNVGISNTSPNAKLVVGPNAGVTSEGLVASFYSGNDTAVSILSNTNNNGAGPRLRLFENNPNRFGTELFYDSGLNSFSIVNYSNNVETGRIHMLSNGNVGIGTNNPLHKLDVNGEISIRGGESADDARMYFLASDNSIRFTIETDFDGTTTNDLLGFRSTANDNILVLKGNGNVGIGTTNPVYALDVRDVGESWIRTDSSTTTADVGLRFAHAGVNHFVIGHQGDDDALVFYDNIAVAERMRINSSGNVGIGTNNPATKLVVRDTNSTIQSVGTAGYGSFYAFSSGTNSSYMFFANASSGDTGRITSNNDGSMAFSNTASNTERMRISGTGNLGIGTTTPQAKLDVNGNIIVKSDITYTSPDGTNQIVTRMLDTDTLSFSGNSGQLFSITDSLTGTIFSVNDISGIPSIEVIDDGTVILAETFGNVLIGTATDDGSNKLQLTGNGKITGNLEVTGTITGTFSGNITGNVTGTASNADLLDNLDSTQFLRSDASDSWNSTLTYTGATNSTALDLTNSDIINVNKIHISDPGEGIHWTGFNSSVQQFVIDDANDNIMTFENVAEIRRSGNKVWDAGNDGSGSGLDADLLDGIQAASFLRSDADDTATGTIFFNDVYNRFNTGNTNNTTTADTNGLYLHTSGYLDGRYTTRFRKRDESGGVPLYVDNSAATANVFTPTARFGSYTGNIHQFEVFGHTGINGNIYLTGTPTTTNQARTIHFTGFDKETIGDVSDAAYIRHTINVGGHTGSVLEFSSQNDVQDGIAFQTNGSSPLKHNSKNIPRIGVSNTPPGATNIVGDLWWDSNQGSLHVYYGNAWVEVNPYLGTTANPQFNSLGVGTPASGTAGEIRATNDVTAYYSDARLKTFEGTIDNAVDKVKQLNGYYFRENKIAKTLGYNNPDRQVGVSAQEVQTVLPEVVVAAPISDEYLTVKYEKMVPLLIEAIKEQQAMIDELRAEIENLKNAGN